MYPPTAPEVLHATTLHPVCCHSTPFHLYFALLPAQPGFFLLMTRVTCSNDCQS